MTSYAEESGAPEFRGCPTLMSTSERSTDGYMSEVALLLGHSRTDFTFNYENPYGSLMETCVCFLLSVRQFRLVCFQFQIHSPVYVTLLKLTIGNIPTKYVELIKSCGWFTLCWMWKARSQNAVWPNKRAISPLKDIEIIIFIAIF